MALGTLKQMKAHLLKEFRIAPEKSRINLYKMPDWQQFSSEKGLPIGTVGVYYPRDLSAHLLYLPECPRLGTLTLFHEYFGHGLWTEHTPSGQEKTRLEQKLLNEERSAHVTKRNLRSFRESSKTYKELLRLHTATRPYNEGFALWMEHYLSSVTGDQEMFLRKLEMLPNEMKGLCARFVDYQSDFGEHALLYSCGFPKHYDSRILEGMLRKLFRAEFDSARLALVYGSRNPRSDIDIFIVSDKIPCSYYGWLDIYSVTENDFQKLAMNLDISVTDPLFSGGFISGDREYMEHARKAVLGTPVTYGKVRHNLESAKNARRKAAENRSNPAKYSNAMMYEKSYFANAQELLKGRKALTLKNLISSRPEDFREVHDNKYKQ